MHRLYVQGRCPLRAPVWRFFFNRCVLLLRDMSRAISHSSASRLEILGRVAQRYIQYLRASGSRFGCMQAIDAALESPYESS